MAAPLLHVSIGSFEIQDAIKLANKAFLSGADVIEISNSLLKRHGYQIVSDIRKYIPKVKIYVDTKIIDNLEEESKMAYEAGADVISVHSSIDEDEILGELSYIRKLGLELSIDLTGVKDILGKILSISYLTPDYFYYKVPYQISKDLKNHPEVFRIIKDLVRISSAPIIVAGLFNTEDYSLCVRLGVRALSIRINEENADRIEEIIRNLKQALEISFP